MVSKGTVKTVNDLLTYIKHDTEQWEHPSPTGRAWFRGQRDSTKPPMPSIFRYRYDEHGLTNMFRYRAAVYEPVPDRTGSTDQWLFLMQHCGVPTRLLDWTESALVGLFFAVFTKEKQKSNNKDNKKTPPDSAVWMLHPLKMNALAKSIGKPEFPNTWANFKGNVVRNNIDRAFWRAGKATQLPIAIQTTFNRATMCNQKSCFTVHGKKETDFEALFQGTSFEEEGYFRKYIIPHDHRSKIEKQLGILGITYSVIYPDLKGLALELEQRFCLGREGNQGKRT